MEKYNRDTPCIKCGFQGARAYYKEGRYYVIGYVAPYLERVCLCGYTWLEKPLDVEGEGKGEKSR